MKSEIYTGTVSAMRTSPWLASEDLDGLGEVQAEIEAVYVHENAVMQDGRTQPRLFAIKFKSREKQMVLNATNRKTLVAAFGQPAKWAGNKVGIYVQDGVKAVGGGKTKGLRLRAKAPAKSMTEALIEEGAQ
jgi:hypothetical protein